KETSKILKVTQQKSLNNDRYAGTDKRGTKRLRADSSDNEECSNSLDTRDPVVFRVHKAILSKVSKEMEMHVNNTMREGLENRMVLHDVTPETFAIFVA